MKYKMTKNFYLKALFILGITFGISSYMNAQTGDIIPTACSTATYTLSSNSTINFYDDGGPGGSCNADNAPGNFANSGCETVTTICAAPGEILTVDFSVLSLNNTGSGWDWLVIYDGPDFNSPILFDNRTGGPDNPNGSSCNYDGSLVDMCASNGCLTFRFYASSVVSREGWEAEVTSSIPTNVPFGLTVIPANCNADGQVFIDNYDPNINYVFNPAGPTINPNGEIVNANYGEQYSIYVPTGNCGITEVFQIDSQLPDTEISTPVEMCENGVPQTLVGTPAGGTWSSSDSTIATVSPTGEVIPLNIGTVTITYDVNGCSTTTDIDVVAGIPPTFTQIDSFCQDKALVPTLPTTSLEGINGTWNPAVIDNSTPGTFTFTFTPNIGECASTQTMDVTVNPRPTPTAIADEPIACVPHTVEFTTNTSSDDNCFWDFGDGTTSFDCGTVTHTYTNSGDYTVTFGVVNEFGCHRELVQTDYIQLGDAPIPGFIPDSMSTTLPNTTVNFTNTSVNATDYLWNFGDESPLSTEDNPTHIFPENVPGTYEVVLYASNDKCTDSTTLTITVINPEIEYSIPNIFTPNADGSNDFFHVIDPYGVKDFSVSILNRWGNIVFESDDINFMWNGKVNNSGIECSEGVYFYTMKFTDLFDEIHEEHGYVHLSR